MRNHGAGAAHPRNLHFVTGHQLEQEGEEVGGVARLPDWFREFPGRSGELRNQQTYFILDEMRACL